MSGRLTHARNGYRAIDCAGCGQEARVDLYGGGLVVQCRAECPEHDVLAGLDVAAVIAELDGKPLAESTLQSFNEIVARPVRWAWQDRIALAKITALAGRPRVGKGLLYSHLIAQVTTGASRATWRALATRSSSPPRTTPETHSSCA
jgi:hypothetical protein